MATTTGQNFGNTGQKNPTETYASDAKDKLNAGMDKAKDTASNIGDKASEMASNVAQTARKVGENLTERAQDAMQSVSSTIRHAGETIREYVPSGSRVAEAFDSTGRYLEKGIGNMGEDFVGIVRRNPIPALLCAAAVGFLLARATRS